MPKPQQYSTKRLLYSGLFLARQKAITENFQSKFGGSMESVERFKIPNGALPHVRLYGRNGKLRATFPGEMQQVDPSEIHKTVEELLGEPVSE